METNLNLLGTGSSGAKLILIGEHSVVYNNPAIAIPFNGLETKVSIYKTNSQITIDCFYHKGFLKDGSSIILGIENLVFYILNKLNIEPFGYHIKIDSNIISQRGLGSSASVSVAMVKALYNAFNAKLSDELLIELAMYAEKVHHTNPSGLDVYTLVYQKPIWFVKDQGFKVIDINFEGTIMIVDSGMMSQTRLAVEHVSKLYHNNMVRIKSKFNQLNDLTNEALISLQSNDINTLGTILNKAQSILKTIEVSNDTLDMLIENLSKFNILGSKLTGGGMGGCVIALIKDYDEATIIKNSLTKLGLNNVWLYPLKELS